MFKRIAAAALTLALFLGMESALGCWGTGYLSHSPATVSEPLEG